MAAAALGVLLLLWPEITALSGRPQGVAMVLVAAAGWAVGTQLIRRTSGCSHAGAVVLDDAVHRHLDDRAGDSV